MQDFPTTNIFNTYRTYCTDQEHLIKERIGLYTFRFHEDGSGAIVQRDICGMVEKEWDVRRAGFVSREALVSHYWEMLIYMAHNTFDTVDSQLDAMVAAT